MMAPKAVLQFPSTNNQTEELHTAPLIHPLHNLHISSPTNYNSICYCNSKHERRYYYG